MRDLTSTRERAILTFCSKQSGKARCPSQKSGRSRTSRQFCCGVEIEQVESELEEAKVLVEPSGATSFAGILANPKREGRAVAVLSGGNVTLEQLSELQFSLGL